MESLGGQRVGLLNLAVGRDEEVIANAGPILPVDPVSSNLSRPMLGRNTRVVNDEALNLP